MNMPIPAFHEQPFTVLNGFSEIKDEPVSDPDNIVRDGGKRLYAWWSDYVARHGMLPTRNSFDILTMLPHAANMFLVARLPGGGWSFHLQGEEFKRLFNGGFQSNALVDRSFAAFPMPVSDYFDKVAESRACRRSFGPVTSSVRNRNTFEGLDCPLVGATGQVTHIIGIAELFRGPTD